MGLLHKKGQIWVETVIYTLIGLSLIGLVLAILTPQIKEYKDRSVIEQSIDSLNAFDSKIDEILDAPGNRRKVELVLGKGVFVVNASGGPTISDKKDSLIYELYGSKSKYSEPGLSVQVGRVNVTTFELTKDYRVILEIKYNYNLTWEGIDAEKEFTAASIPYKFFLTNNGTQPSGAIQIDFTEG